MRRADLKPSEAGFGGRLAEGCDRRAALFRGDASGSSAVEFGLVAAPFLVLLFGALQLFLLFLSQQLLETAAETSSRTIMTGSAQNAGKTSDGFKQTVCSAIPAILSCTGVMVDVQVASSFSSANTSTPTLTYDQNGKVTNSWNFNMGKPGNIVVVRVMYQWPMFNLLNFQLTNLSNGSRMLMATAVFKNEAYQ